MLVRVQPAGARDAALDLVEHQQQAMFVGEPAQTLEERLGRRADAALALDRLDQEARGGVVDQRLGGGEIVERGVAEAGQQRLEPAAHLVLIGPPRSCRACGRGTRS